MVASLRMAVQLGCGYALAPDPDLPGPDFEAWASARPPCLGNNVAMDFAILLLGGEQARQRLRTLPLMAWVSSAARRHRPPSQRTRSMR